jgi:hypothetical protein
LLSHPLRERLLSLLLVGALLLCHGALGSLHQLECCVLFEHPLTEYTSHQEEHGAADDHTSGARDYAAALFVLLLGMIYALLRREARDRYALPAPRRSGLLPAIKTFHLPRGPDPPLLQVFRL